MIVLEQKRESCWLTEEWRGSSLELHQEKDGVFILVHISSLFLSRVPQMFYWVIV